MWPSSHGSGVSSKAKTGYIAKARRSVKADRFVKAGRQVKAGLFSKAMNRSGWAFESLAWQLQAPFCRRSLAERQPLDLTIGITTFKDRFDNCLRPLLTKLSILFPNEQIIVIANGHYLADEQLDFMERFEAFCKRFRNVDPESFADPRGLSFLWNRIIARASSDNIFILNDDIMIKACFRRFIEESGIVRAPVATINSSWSHFKISGDIIDRVGLFDEGFTEIGGEDDDYIARMAMHGLAPDNFSTGSLKKASTGRSRPDAVNSYGKIMAEQQGGYSTVNTEYLRSKWKTSDEHFEGAVEVKGRSTRYWKLK